MALSTSTIVVGKRKARITMELSNRIRPELLSFLLVVIIATIGSGCASQSTALVEDVSTPTEGPTAWSEVERVDLASFIEEPIQNDRKVVHDVPEVLMTNSADSGVLEEVDGFRIQVFASEVRTDAVQAEEEARVWTQSLSEKRMQDLGIEKKPAIYSSYKQPYYRVRLGDFVSRSQAQPIVEVLKSRFTGALIVPDIIQIRR